MTSHTPDNCPLRERMVRVEVENELAVPLHKEFRQDIEDLKTGVGDLKVGQAKIQTTLKLLETNGRRSRKNQAGIVAGAVVIIGAVSAAVVAVSQVFIV